VRALYAIRVFVISVEALVLLVAVLVWIYAQPLLDDVARGLGLNDELLKYLLLLPLGLAAWIVNEVRLLLHEDRETTRILTAWPDYWRLKSHVWVALLYALVFAALSIAPWVVKAGITRPSGLLLFVTSIAGQLVVAASVYAARLRVKEFVANASAV